MRRLEGQAVFVAGGAGRLGTAACRRLAETEETVAALAVELGFFDHAHFTRCFRSIMGLTPAQYREQRTLKGTKRG